MLNNYSWGDYLAAVAILVAGYYFLIGALYYRREIKQLISGKVGFKKRAITEGLPGQAEQNMEEKDTGKAAMNRP